MTYLFYTADRGKIEVTERCTEHPNGRIYFFVQDYETEFEEGGNGFRDMWGAEFYAYLPIRGHSSKDASICVWVPQEIARIKG